MKTKTSIAVHALVLNMPRESVAHYKAIVTAQGENENYRTGLLLMNTLVSSFEDAFAVVFPIASELQDMYEEGIRDLAVASGRRAELRNKMTEIVDEPAAVAFDKIMDLNDDLVTLLKTAVEEIKKLPSERVPFPQPSVN